MNAVRLLLGLLLVAACVMPGALLAHPASSVQREDPADLLTEIRIEDADAFAEPADAFGAAQDDDTEEMTADERERLEARERLIEMSCTDEREPLSWMDRTHSYVSQRLCEPAAWFDGFFGDPRAFEETPVGTFFRLRNELHWDETEGVRLRARLMANVSLPRVSDRMRLLVFRDEDLRGDFDEEPRVDGSETRTRLGLRFIGRDRTRSAFDIDATVRANVTSLNPILRARYRHTQPFSDRTQGRFTQLAFWERDDGVGTTTRLDWEWFLDRNTQLRWTGQGTFSEQSDGIDWASSLVGFRQLDRRSAIRSEVGIAGSTRRPGFHTEEYFVNFRYRRSVLRPWLFYELQPERAWPRDAEERKRRGDWRFTATLEIQFENESSRRERVRRENGPERDIDL